MKEKIAQWFERIYEKTIANAPAILSFGVGGTVAMVVFGVFAAMLNLWALTALFTICGIGFLTLVVGGSIVLSLAIERETRRRIAERTANNKGSSPIFKDFNGMIEETIAKGR